jgi:hypothetical protein
MEKLPDHCPLCNSISSVFYNNHKRLYYNCKACDAIFLSKDSYITQEQEKKRYLEHKNDVNDPGYQRFVSPIVSFVTGNFSPEKHRGLDFGSGTGPVISRMLELEGFEMIRYDPFFYPDKKGLDEKYDFIVCCEVVEHFHRPYEEFLLLFNLLQKKGKLICMTNIYEQSTAFGSWYYKNDPTHVFIYQKETFEWIKDRVKFTSLEIDQNLVILSR